MAFQPAPQCVKAELNGLQNGVPIVNIFNVDVNGVPTLTDLGNVATEVGTFWGNLKTVLHSSYILQDITVTDISVANGQQVIDTTHSGETGLVTTAPMAANAAMVVSLRTPFIGRSFRGRIYFGGLPEASLADAQTFTSGAASAMAGAMAAFITALTAAGYALSVVSRFALGVARVTALLTDVVALITDTKVDSQRRRTAN